MGNRSRHWADLLAELGGATALAGGAGVSAWLVAPLTSVAPSVLAGSAAAIGGLAGWALVRAAPGDRTQRAIPTFALEPLDDLDDLEDGAPAAPELLPDEGSAEPSRVVHLFDPPTAQTPATQTPGDLQARIAAHLGDHFSSGPSTGGPASTSGDGSPAIPDARDALHAALDEIRRSLRAG